MSSHFESQIKEISTEGQGLTTVIKSLIFEIKDMNVLPNYMEHTANTFTEVAATELLDYNIFFSELPTFAIEALKEEKTPAATLLAKFSIQKGIRKIWHPSDIPKTDFEDDMLLSLRSIYIGYLEGLKELLELYKEKLALPNEEWLKTYKIQLGEKVSMRLVLMNSQLPCMEGEINTIEQIVKSFAITPSKPPNKPTTTSNGSIKKYTMNGSFSDYKKLIQNKYDVLNLLVLSFRSAICDADFNNKNRSEELQYYNMDNFMAFIQYLKEKNFLKEPLLEPFQQQTYVEGILKELYGLDYANEFFEEMKSTELCYKVLDKIRNLKSTKGTFKHNEDNFNAKEGGKRKQTKKRKQHKRKSRRHRKN